MSITTEAAATAEIPYDVLLITQAQGVFTRARSAEWPEPGRRVIGNAVLDLDGALNRYSELSNGIVPAGIARMPAGATGFTAALRSAAEDAWEAAGEVTEGIRNHCGEETAAYVAGENGGEQ